MTEKLNINDLREDFLIDKIADKVSKSKLVKALFLGGTMALASQLVACVTPPAAEVSPLNEAVLSGVFSQDSVDKLSGNAKIMVENSLAYIGNKYAEDEKFVPGTEMIYVVGRGTDSFAWYLAGFGNDDGTVGLKVTDFCEDLRDVKNCQNIERDLLMVEGEGNRLCGFIDENNEQHPILLIDKDNNPTAFDINGSSYVEQVANSQGFVEKIVSMGAISVQAAVEATATATVTPEPTPVYEVQASEGEYSPSQEAINKSKSTIDQKDRIQRWLDYWIKFENRPFAWESTELNWKYVYDNLDSPNEVLVLLEVGGEDGNKLFTVPVVDGEFLEYPPTVGGENIEMGNEPMELSSGDEGLWLSVQDGIPVRRDGSGVVVEKFNMESGQWDEISEGYNFSSSINPDKIPNLQKWFLYQPSDGMFVNNEPNTVSYGVVDVFALSYELVDEGSGGSLYVNFLSSGGISRVKIGYVMFEKQRDLIFKVNQLTPKEAIQIAEYFNDGFSQRNNDLDNDFTEKYDGRINITNINSASEAKVCKKWLQDNKYRDDMCFYQIGSDNFTSQEVIDSFKNAVLPIGNNSPIDLAEFENMNVFPSAEQSFVVVLQLTERSGE